jgi:hypothetical protein
MSLLSKILLSISIVCYLATSSVAAAHAFPIMGNMSDSDITSLDVEVTLVENVKQVEAGNGLMTCHQEPSAYTGFANSGSTDSGNGAKASGICKIFCSAIGHAFLTSDPLQAEAKFHHTSPASYNDRLFTRQLSVEHQPPK